jgi:hypothetical protein
MGASTVAGATTTGPRRISAGTRAPAGMARSVRFSHSFFTVKPLPAIANLIKLERLSVFDSHIDIGSASKVAFTSTTRTKTCPWGPR